MKPFFNKFSNVDSNPGLLSKAKACYRCLRPVSQGHDCKVEPEQNKGEVEPEGELSLPLPELLLGGSSVARPAVPDHRRLAVGDHASLAEGHQTCHNFQFYSLDQKQFNAVCRLTVREWHPAFVLCSLFLYAYACKCVEEWRVRVRLQFKEWLQSRRSS